MAKRQFRVSFPHLLRSLGIGVIAFVILVLAAALGGLGGFVVAVFFVLAAFWGLRRRRNARKRSDTRT